LKHSKFGEKWSIVVTVQEDVCEISGFFRCRIEAFVLLGCYAA